MIFVLEIDVLDAAKKAAQNWNLAPLEKYVDFGFLPTTTLGLHYTYLTNYLMGTYFFTFWYKIVICCIVAWYFWSFFKITNSQIFFVKTSWIGPWVSRIDWCEGHWCGSTYMAMRLSNISSKTDKRCIFCVLRPFLSLGRTASKTGKNFAFSVFSSWKICIFRFQIIKSNNILTKMVSFKILVVVGLVAFIGSTGKK